MRGEQRHLSYGVIRYRVALSNKSGHVPPCRRKRKLAALRRGIAVCWRCPSRDSRSETGASNHALRTQRLRPSAACNLARAPSAARSSPEGASARAGGKDGSWLGAQSPLHVLRRRCGNSHRNLRRRATNLQPDPCTRLPLKANLLRFRAFPTTRARLPPVPRGRKNGRQGRTAGRATSTPCVAQARLCRTRSFKLRAIINSYAPVIMRSPHPHF
jgi:hypothetical protein